MRNFLSRKEADELGDALVQQYMGKNKDFPLFVDIDGFTTDFLRCQVLYETFAEDDMDKIGFSSDGITSLSVHREGKQRKWFFPATQLFWRKVCLSRVSNSDGDLHWLMRPDI